MASWLISHKLVILLVCITSSSVVSIPTNDNNPLESSVPGSDITKSKETPSLDLSWPAPYDPTTPVNLNTSQIQNGSVYNLTHPHLASPRVQCDALIYGHGLRVASCQEAYELLPRSMDRISVGPRSLRPFDIPLPFRFLSREYDYVQYSAIDLAHVLAHTC